MDVNYIEKIIREYSQITVSEAEQYETNGYTIICDADYLIAKIIKGE